MPNLLLFQAWMTKELNATKQTFLQWCGKQEQPGTHADPMAILLCARSQARKLTLLASTAADGVAIWGSDAMINDDVLIASFGDRRYMSIKVGKMLAFQQLLLFTRMKLFLFVHNLSIFYLQPCED